MRHDKLIAEFEKAATMLASIAEGVKGSKRKGRGAAFDMASVYLALIGQHMNELVGFFEGKPEKVDEWLDRHFAPLEELGEPDWRELVTAIQRGLEKARYTKEGVKPFLAEARKDSKAAPRAHEPLTTQVAKLHAMVKDLRSTLKAMTKRAMVAEDKLAKLHKVIDRV